MWRRILLVILLLIACAGAALYWYARPLPVLTVTTWPGVYGRAQSSAQITPYGTEKHVNVRIAEYDGSLDELRKAVKSGVYPTDVMDMELPAAVQACGEGLLEPVDAATLPPGGDGKPAAQDFFKGMIGPCWVASAIYSQMIVFGPHLGADDPDAAIALLGRARDNQTIGLQRGAKVNLELALLASGVKPQDIYPTLEREDGVARAFAVLQSVKKNIAWWTSSREAMRALREDRVAATTALSGDIQEALANGQDMHVAWSRQFTEADVLAVPKGTPKKDMAMDYVRHATGSAPLADMAKWAPYAPPRRSSDALLAGLPQIPLTQFVRSQHQALDQAFAVDDAWWQKHGAVLEARFRTWADAP